MGYAQKASQSVGGVKGGATRPRIPLTLRGVLPGVIHWTVSGTGLPLTLGKAQRGKRLTRLKFQPTTLRKQWPLRERQIYCVLRIISTITAANNHKKSRPYKQ